MSGGFFFSSRRRHTRCGRDWSSDVCSSDLLEAAEQAKRLAAPDKPEPPSVCRLSGRIESRGGKDVAILRVEFQFRTTVPRSAVLLGLQKGKPVAATIDDGKLAVLMPLKDDDGFALQVDA